MSNTTSYTRLAATFIAAALTACGGGGSDGTTPGTNGTVDIASASLPAGADCGIANMPQQLLAAINAARAQARSCGDAQMPANAAISYWNTKLADSALRHSSDMATHGFFSHIGSDGSDPSQRVIAAGYGNGGVGEILAAPKGSYSTSQVVGLSMNAWLASPGHCNVIMGAGSSEIGAACVRAGSTSYLTVEFGN